MSDTSLKYHPETISKYLHLLYTADNKDITFKFENSSTILKAHKLILEAVSPIFKMMFSGSFLETNSATVRNMSPVVFKKVIKAVYLVPFEITNVEEAAELCNAGEMYELDHLKEISGNYMLQKLNWDNCLFLYEKASLFHLTDLFANCKRKFQRDCLLIFVRHLFQKLEITESAFIDAAAYWEGKPGDLYQILESYVEMGILKEYKNVIRNIKFHSMDVESILSAKLFTEEEKCEILAYKEACNKEEEAPLPPYLSQHCVLLKPDEYVVEHFSDYIWIALLRTAPNMQYATILMEKYARVSETFTKDEVGREFKELFHKQIHGVNINSIRYDGTYFPPMTYILKFFGTIYNQKDELEEVQLQYHIYSKNSREEGTYVLYIKFNRD